MSNVRIGYAGLDHHHRDPYFQLFEQLPVEVVAAAEPDESFDIGTLREDEERPDSMETDVDAGEIVGDAPFYRDPVEMVESEALDLVWVTLSNRDTPTVLEAGVDQGYDIFTEKPGARTAADLEPVAEKVRERDVTVGTDYFYRYHPIAKALRRRVADGFFGDVWAFESKLHATQLAHRRTDHYLYQWAPSRGGIVQWIGLHYIDLLMDVLGENITRVCAQTIDRTDDTDVEDGATLQFETESGAIGTVTTGYYVHEGKETEVAIYGDDAWATTPLRSRVDRDEPVDLELFSDDPDWMGAPNRTITYDIAYDRPPFGDFGFEFFEEFIAACQGDAASPAGIDDLLRVLRVLDAIYESADTDRWVSVT